MTLSRLKQIYNCTHYLDYANSKPGEVVRCKHCQASDRLIARWMR